MSQEKGTKSHTVIKVAIFKDKELFGGGTMGKCCHLKGERKNKADLKFPESKTPIQKMGKKCLTVLREMKLRHVHFGYVTSPSDRKY